MLLSIIVPVYNVEPYLRRCVDSLLDQGAFRDYEILLVDDGSTDQSGRICDEYAAAHAKVRVLHKKNGGLSSARNAGLASAEGEYVLFVDSDDYLRTDCLTALLETAQRQNADIVCFNYAYVSEPYSCEFNTVHTDIGDRVLTGQAYLLENLKNGTMQMSACMNLYRLRLIMDNRPLFREGYVHEDEEWTPRVFCAAGRVCQHWTPIYGYYVRNNSISRADKSRKASLDLVENCKSLKDYCTGLQNPALRQALENNTVMLALSAFYKGRLTDRAADIQELIGGLYAEGKNEKKRKLFSLSPSGYLAINEGAKKLGGVKPAAKSALRFCKKCRDFGMQEVHKLSRERLICKDQKRKLENHTFSILSSTCNGGVISSELGEQFRSPTVNLWMTPEDFLKLASHPERYMQQDVIEVTNRFQPYPVGRIDDITLYFMHYHTFAEAREKWNQRKARINYDDLALMMAEKDGCTPEMVAQFDALPYRHKVIFTKNAYPQFRSAVQVSDRTDKQDVGIMTDFVGLAGRRYDSCFDYVAWLNGELD